MAKPAAPKSRSARTAAVISQTGDTPATAAGSNAPAPFGDLRGWIDALRREGELHDIDVECDWDCEIGTVTRKAFGNGDGPALMFNNIKGYNKAGARCTKLFTGRAAVDGIVPGLRGSARQTANAQCSVGSDRSSPITLRPDELKPGYSHVALRVDLKQHFTPPSWAVAATTRQRLAPKQAFGSRIRKRGGTCVPPPGFNPAFKRLRPPNRARPAAACR